LGSRKKQLKGSLFKYGSKPAQVRTESTPTV
jgi:hypothetical protein